VKKSARPIIILQEQRMVSRLNPYIAFPGTARAAMSFYQSVFGGDLVLNTFGEAGMQDANPDGIMHAMLTAPNGMVLMGSDAFTEDEQSVGTGMSISLSGDEAAELRGYWDGLSADAEILEPLVQAPWGDTFGMLIDKFGVKWMVNIAGKPQA
jgi:PhnB protein